MNKYIINFRLEDSQTYSERYSALYNYFEKNGKFLDNFDVENYTTSTIKWTTDIKDTKDIANNLLKEANLINGDTIEFIKTDKRKITNQDKYIACIVEIGKIINKTYFVDTETLNKFIS